jgi:hypothetical protein
MVIFMLKHTNSSTKQDCNRLYKKNIKESNTDPTYDYSTMGTTTQRKDANSIYDHTLESMHSSHVGSRSNTDPTYDYSTMGTTQRKDANSIYDHTMESMYSSNVGSRSNTDPTYAHLIIHNHDIISLFHYTYFN